jgi:hypothetical protein
MRTFHNGAEECSLARESGTHTILLSEAGSLEFKNRSPEHLDRVECLWFILASHTLCFLPFVISAVHLSLPGLWAPSPHAPSLLVLSACPRLVSAFAYFISLPKLSVSLHSHDPMPRRHSP